MARTYSIFRLLQVAAILFGATCTLASEKHAGSGLVLKIDGPRKTIVISCREIPGYMDAMAMPFSVADEKNLANLKAGMTVDFDLIERDGRQYAENIRAKDTQNFELDPTAARRLKGVEEAMSPSSTKGVGIGQPVPDFQLIDQLGRPVSLSQFRGKVVAVTFVYTRCPFPTYCIRFSDNFARLQKRFRDRIGRDLVLLTVVIDPVHDNPATLKKYAQTWKADPAGWHFLTGAPDQVQKVCARFDMNYYPDEALYIHSFHTAVITRAGLLAANLEGNEFTAQQLGDLVQTAMSNSN